MTVFFFQAEDGIRDSSVTGVQTCALPISDEVSPDDPDGPAGRLAAFQRRGGGKQPADQQGRPGHRGTPRPWWAGGERPGLEIVPGRPAEIGRAARRERV